MTIEDLNEISILLDQYTLIRLKMQQLQMNEPHPENYYELLEELHNHLQSSKDLLLETLFAKNAIKVTTHIQKNG